MIHLLTLLCSLIINLGAVGITPYNMWSLNATNESYIDTVKSQITGSKSRYWGSFSNYVNIPNEYWIVIKGFNSSGSDIVCLAPNEYVDNTKTTTITCNSYTTDENNVVSSAKLKFNQYTAFPVATNLNWVESNANIYGWKTYNFLSGNWSLLYCQSPIYYESQLIINVTDEVTVPVIDGIGSLGGGTGHSLAGDPLNELSSFSWTAAHGTFALNGHSVGVSQNQSTPDFTNPTQNLLGQIIDNTNSIISNINGIGDYLGGVVSNIREGFSAIFNGISQFNNNFISLGNYIIEPLDQDLILDHVEDMSFYTLVSTINSAGSHISSSINNISDNQSLIFPIDLRNTYFSNAGIMYLDLTFLDDTKSTWQPLLIAFLYITLAFNILMSLPSIIQGQSREGGKSD